MRAELPVLSLSRLAWAGLPVCIPCCGVGTLPRGVAWRGAARRGEGPGRVEMTRIDM